MGSVIRIQMLDGVVRVPLRDNDIVLVSLFLYHINIPGLFNTKPMLLEEQSHNIWFTLSNRDINNRYTVIVRNNFDTIQEMSETNAPND